MVEAVDARDPEVARREAVKRMLATHIGHRSVVGIVVFLMDIGLYAAAIAGILFLEPMWAKIALSIYAGIKLANLGTLGHDAGHGNLTAWPKVNEVLGAICFLPGLYNWTLWKFDHHHVHHPNTNGAHEDSWTPMTKAQFDALPAHRRLLERLYRNSWGLGLAPYYIFERWSHVKFIPGAFLPKRFRVAAWANFALVITYLAGFLALLATAPLYSNTSAVTALVLGFAVPFYIWMTLFSFTVYVQHTHKRIPWFEGAVDRRIAFPQEALSLHLDFPKPIKTLMHNVYEHAAHHANVRIPFHRLPQAQAELNRLSGDRAVYQKFSFGWLHETLRDCRLYDYDNHQWLDFDGKPTTGAIVSESQRATLHKWSPGNEYVLQA